MAAYLNPFDAIPEKGYLRAENRINLRRIRIWIGIFVFFLLMSGITAFPIETEMGWIDAFLNWLAVDHYMVDWLRMVSQGVREIYGEYPFIAYGTDWLAFAHIVIAVVFIGPLIDPVRNIWVLQFGMIACVMIFPLALIAGHVREIPLLWRLGDCLFGILGFFPLWLVYRKTRQLEKNTNPQFNPA